MRYEGSHYGQYQGAVIERTDYLSQRGSLYKACKDCDEDLYKSRAYDVLKPVETGAFNDLRDTDGTKYD